MAQTSTAENKPAAAKRSTLLGAVFLMATSAIGPGFITQTTEFTIQFGAAFAFAILVSILVDVAVQLNVWRDSPGAVTIADTVRARLVAGGVALEPFTWRGM